MGPTNNRCWRSWIGENGYKYKSVEDVVGADYCEEIYWERIEERVNIYPSMVRHAGPIAQ